MPIENRNLKPGAKLIARYHKESYSCEVVEGESGKLKYRLQDGREFRSPSAAGMAVTGHACDGWVFWSVQSTENTRAAETPQLETTKEPAQTVEHADTPAEKNLPVFNGEDISVVMKVPNTPKKKPEKTWKRIYRVPNQKGVPEGQTRWYCHDCGSFLAPAGETPTTCPNGHQAT